MAGDWDDLWGTSNGSTSWLTGCSPEELDFLNELADLIVAKGREPTWVRVHERYLAMFGPNRAPSVPGTIANHVRNMVKQRA